MKNITFYIFFFLLIIKVNSQNTYRALYNIHFEINENAEKIDESKLDPNKIRILKKMRTNYKNSLAQSYMVDFILDFNKNYSFFYLPDQLEIEQGSLTILKRLGRYNGKYYLDGEFTILQTNAYGQEFILEIPQFKWQISNYSIKIGEYICYKATTSKLLEGSNGIFKQEIVAWFTPEIPFNFGPKEYNGLPGLIVKLDEGNISYKLKSLKKIEDTAFKKPKKGKKITQEEFNLLSKSMLEKLKKGN